MAPGSSALRVNPVHAVISVSNKNPNKEESSFEPKKFTFPRLDGVVAKTLTFTCSIERRNQQGFLKKEPASRFQTNSFEDCREEVTLFLQNSLFIFTDLRAAGLPAELKHIIQRRKRKQP